MDEVGAVGSFEAADGEVAFGEALEVIGEEDVEGETAGGSGDGNELGCGFLADFKTEAGGDAGDEGDEHGCALPGDPLLREVGGGIAGDLGEGGAGGVVGAVEGFAASAFRAEGEDLEAGEGVSRLRKIFTLPAGDFSDGVEHDGGGNGELDDEAGQAEEAADGTGGGGGEGVGPLAADGGVGGLTEGEGGVEALPERLVDGVADRLLGATGKHVEDGFDGHADLGGDGHGEAAGFKQGDGGLEIGEVVGRELTHKERVPERAGVTCTG